MRMMKSLNKYRDSKLILILTKLRSGGQKDLFSNSKFMIKINTIEDRKMPVNKLTYEHLILIAFKKNNQNNTMRVEESNNYFLANLKYLRKESYKKILIILILKETFITKTRMPKQNIGSIGSIRQLLLLRIELRIDPIQ